MKQFRLTIRAVLGICTLLTLFGIYQQQTWAAPDAPDDPDAVLLNLDPSRSRVATLPQGLGGMAAVYVPDDGMVYLLGGYHTKADGSRRTVVKDVWRYDPLLDDLTHIGELDAGLALAGHAYVPSEGKIYLFGGLIEDPAEGADGLIVSGEIRTFDINNREPGKLGTTISPRARASAVLVPDQEQIFIFGGTDGPNAFSGKVSQVDRFDLASQSVQQQVANLPGSSWYRTAHHLPGWYLAAPGPVAGPAPNVQNGVLVLGTSGYALFDPVSQTFPLSQETAQFSLVTGAASVYVPTRLQVWSVGGCVDAAVNEIDPFLSDPPHRVTTLPQGKVNDSAAVYVPALDRVLGFGGFVVADTNETKCTTTGDKWTDMPPTDQYSQQIFSISPEFLAEDPRAQAGTRLAPVELLGNPVIGSVVSINVAQGDASEPFVLAVQAPFLTPGRGVEFATRIVQVVTGQGGAASVAVTPTLQIELPSEIATATDARAQQPIAICAISQSRNMPPNCKELLVTLKPGGLTGTIERDMTALNQPGVRQPVPNATVELLDVDGDLVMTTTTGTDGSYSFCNQGQFCLGLGKYTLNIWKAFDPQEGFGHKPMSVAAEVKAETTATADATLEATPKPGPLINAFHVYHNALVGDQIGTFLAFDHLPASVPRPNVRNAFWVGTQHLTPVQETVRVEFILNGTKVEDTNSSDGWGAAFNMSAVLQAGSNLLQIIAYDQFGQPGEAREYRVQAVAAKPISGPASYIEVESVRWNPRTETYRTRVLVPKDLRWPKNEAGFPREIDLVLFEFYNLLRADVEIIEEYHIAGTWRGNGNAGMLLQLMSSSKNSGQVNWPFSVSSIYNGSFVDSYVVRSPRIDLCFWNLIHKSKLAQNPLTKAHFDAAYKHDMAQQPKNIQTLDKFRCGKWIPLGKGKEFEKTIKDIPIKGNFTTSIRWDASMVLQGTLDGDTWQLNEIRLIPRPELGLKGELILQADFKLATAKAGLYAQGKVAADLPIVYRPLESQEFYLDTPCVNFRISWGAWLDIREKIFGSQHRYDFGPSTLLNESVPVGCTFPKAREADQATTDFFEPPDVMPLPATAVTSKYDDHTILRLWVEDSDPDPDLVDKALAYDVGGVGANYPKAYFHKATGLADPNVGFLNDNTGLAVWSQVDYDPANGTDPSVVEYYSYQELYYATWNRVQNTWSSPVKLTDNRVNDGSPALATSPDGKALLAWVRDLDGDPNTKNDWQILSRYWDGTAWGPEMEVARDDSSADFEPAIAYNHNGTRAWLVWVREHDADPTTNKDRRLAYVEWTGSGWSAVQEPGSWPVGALHPSVVFSPLNQDRPLVTMIVVDELPPVDGETRAEPEPAGIGTENELWAAWWGPDASGWDVDKISDTRGEWPQTMLVSDDRALILLRTFGGGDNSASLGQIAAVEAELNRDGARWATPGLLTTDENQIVWQVGGTILPLTSATGNMAFDVMGVHENTTVRREAAQRWRSGAAATIQTAATAPAVMRGGDARTGVIGMSPEVGGVILAIEWVTVSHDIPAVGETVTVTVQVRNTTIRPLTESGNTFFVVSLLNSAGSEIARQEYDADSTHPDLLFNEIAVLALPYRSTGRTEEITMRLNYNSDLNIPAITDTKLVIGKLPPPQMINLSDEVARLRDRNATVPLYLSWSPPVTGTDAIWTYRVYTGPDAEGPWTLLGQTSDTIFTDPMPVDPLAYYAVEAYNEQNSRSPKAVITLKPPPALPPVEPGPVPPEEESGQFGVYLPAVLR